MTELSQAERTAMDDCFGRIGPAVERRGFDEGWSGARDHYSKEFAELYENFRESQSQRDYWRERERSLAEAMTEAIAVATRTEWDVDPEIQMILAPLRAALASPGEPEGQCSWCDGKRVLMEPDGSKHQPCPHCQPDHGPGEPNEADQAVGEAAAILRKIVLKRDPRVQEPEPVPLGVRIAAESWLAAYEPSRALMGESNG
jgi:hypothetical protein